MVFDVSHDELILFHQLNMKNINSCSIHTAQLKSGCFLFFLFVGQSYFEKVTKQTRQIVLKSVLLSFLVSKKAVRKAILKRLP